MLNAIADGFAAGTYAVVILALFLVLPMFIYGPTFETKYYPVVLWAEFSEMSRTSKTTTYQMKFEKQRNCSALTTTFAWYVVRPNEFLERVNIQNLSRTASRPTGLNIRGVTVENQDIGPYVSQKMVLTHRCHPFWVTESIINIPIGSETP